MSLILPQVNLSSVIGQFTLNTRNTPLTQCAWLEFLNESPYTLQVQIGGINLQIPAWYDYPVQVQQRNQAGAWQAVKGAQFPVIITPMLLVNNIQVSSTQLLSTLYVPGETPAITTPQPLVRQTFVGNNINTVGGVASTTQNDGNNTGTVVVEATVLGDASSAVVIENNGFVSLGTVFHPAQLNFVTSLGTITINTSGVVTIPNQIITNLITALAGNDLGLHVGAGQRVAHTVNGVDIVQSDSTGVTLLNGSLFLPGGGSFTRVSFFGQISLNTTQATFNHNLGVVPDMVVLVPNGTSSTSRTYQVDFTTLTSSQFKATGNSGFTAFGYAIKF